MPKQRDPFENQLAKIVGANVRQAREARHISAAQLAELLGCSERTVTSYETGDRRISLADAVRISYALGIDIDRLVLNTKLVVKLLPKIKISDLKPNV